MSQHPIDTIAAIATAPGRGGVGIVRVSGPLSRNISEQLIPNKTLKNRQAHFGDFTWQNALIDQGIALFFENPHSFTGEDVLELQAHGGPIILDRLLQACINAGARLARPGEFSERAFLNDKLDLAQAEAIADLIEASTEQAAQRALNSLKGVFSEKIHSLVEQLIHLRMYVESAIDFPEEEIDFLSDGHIGNTLSELIESTQSVLAQAQQGALVREGMKVVILGRPNAGKSSLLNALAAKDIAIVTEIAGTTRDVLREHIHIDGMPLHIIDTAGIREGADTVEKIGIDRAWQEAQEADCILLLIDTSDPDQQSVERNWPKLFANETLRKKIFVVFNKIDVSENPPLISENHASISAKTGLGLDVLKQKLKAIMGYQNTTEGAFSARRRHLICLEQALRYLKQGAEQLNQHAAGELLADDLRQAQQQLNEITGEFTADDLLGKIFSSFCIGK